MHIALNTALFICIFILGASVGNILCLVAQWLPAKKGPLFSKQYCPHCHHELTILDTVPILSYFLLRGSCRYCGKCISPRLLLIECLSGGLALLCYLAFLPPGSFLLSVDNTQFFGVSAQDVGLVATWVPFELPAYYGAFIAAALCSLVLCLLGLVTLIDTATMEIPNALSLWLALLGIVGFAFGPTAALPWTDHLIGAFSVSVPMLLLTLIIKGSFGLGDVKLMAAAGLFLGWQLAVVATLIGIFLGGIYGIYVLAMGKKGRKEHFAFGPALCAGIVFSLFMGQQVITWYAGFF